MAYAFKQIEAHDPNNPGLVAPNAMVTIFEPGDPAKTPLTLTTLDGQALANPVTVNGLGYGPAFMHATLSQVAWAGGGLTGTFESYEGMRDEAIAARDAANTAAANAAVEAAAAAEAELTARIASGEFKGEPGVDGANVLPTDTAIAERIADPASETKAALDATITTAAAGKLDGAPATRTPRPLVVFTFDDGAIEDLTVIKPILDGKNVKGSFAINPSTVGTSSAKLTWAQVKQLRDEGHEITDHSYSHANLGTADDALIAAQMDASKAMFAANGVTPAGFVWPYAANNALARKAARRLYPFALGGTAGTTQPLHTYAIKRVSLNDSTTLASHQTQINSAITNNEVLIFVSHSGTEMAGAGRTVLADVIAYAQSSSVPVVTAAEAFDLVGNIVDAGDLPGGADFTVVDGQGRLKTSVSGLVVAGAINPTAAAAPNSYLAGAVTYQRVSGPGNTDWPTTGAVGNIITNRLDTVSYLYTSQQFISDTNVIYTRRAASDTTWGAWETAGIGKLATTNTITSTTTPVSFTAGKVTYSLVSSTSNTTADGWPAPGAGASVITSRAGTTSTSTYATQTFIGPNGTTFSRRGASDTTWGAWVGNGVIGSDAAAGNLTPDAFPLGTVMHTIPLSGSTGPDAKQGVLSTSRAHATIHTYTTQTFNEQGGGTMHRRMGLTATTWSAWKVVTLT